MQKVKGYCPVCNAVRAFRVTYAEADTVVVHSIGSIMPHTVVGATRYRGKCSKGCACAFERIYPPSAPRYRREALRIHYTTRGAFAKQRYLEHRASFRYLDREAHYRPDHECDENCPEYNYPEYWD